METLPLVAAVLLVSAATWFLSLRRRRSLPPGPFPYPIVGNMLQLGSQPHMTFAKLSKKYGPLMSFHIGSLYTVVVSSPEMAKEILQRHGQVFTGRIVAQAGQACGHDKISMAFLPAAGGEWRDMRKICKEQMFSQRSMERSNGLREQKLLQLLDYAQKCSDEGRAINIREAAFTTTLNLMSATLFSMQATEFDSKATMEFKEIMVGVATILGVPNFADYFPILRTFDPQGIKKKADVYFRRLLGLIEGHLNERISFRKANPDAPKKDDFLETLIDALDTRDYKLNTDHLTHLMLDLYVAGSETSTTSVEWLMWDLVANPEKMAKVKAELKSVMGEEKFVDESMIARLPYLQAVVKESLRLNPPGPLLLPRKAESDQVVNGYLIPKGTQVLINAYAIGRDPNVWKNPEAFEPERFLDGKIDFKGQDFKLLPFGAGRRICPGMPLANCIIHTVTANLVHNFDWKLQGPEPSGAHDALLSGFVVRRTVPLKIVPFKA